MKKFSYLALLALCAGCSNQYASRQNPLTRTYVHKYGLEVDKSDWEKRGECGTIVTIRKDGVKVTESYEDGKRHGPITYSFPHSESIASVEIYRHGVLASATDGYDTGLPKQEIRYLPGNERHVTQWYEDGTPRSSEIYYGKLLNWGEYYSPLNVADSWVIDGEGMRLLRDSRGNLEMEEMVCNGQTARATTFYASGDPASITYFAGGKRHGERRTFLEGGLPQTVEHWSDGELNGDVVSYANGRRSAITPYVNGERNGIEKIFGVSGEVVEEITWREGQKHGPDTFMLAGGEKMDWYHHDHMVSKHTYDKLNPQPAEH
jgi:antitoxin component YwqK of YwqJK toxin-antitoxin module